MNAKIRSTQSVRAGRLSVAVHAALATGLFAAIAVGAAAAAPQALLHLNAGTLDPSSDALAAQRGSVAKTEGRQLHLIQFAGPIKPDWYSALAASGAQIVDYVPDYAYIVYADATALSALNQLAQGPSVQWNGLFSADLKISRQVYEWESRGVMPDYYSIQLVLDPATNAETLAQIKRLARNNDYRVETFRHYVNVWASLPLGTLSTIADRADVLSIQPDMIPELHDERQNLILANRLTGGSPNRPIPPSEPGGIGYLEWLAARGFSQAQFDASGFSVDNADQGLDNGTSQPNHFALWEFGDPGSPLVPTRTRVVYNKLEGSALPADLTGCGGVGHGTWTAHVVAGSVASVPRSFPHGDAGLTPTAERGFHYAGGVNPFARVGSSIFFTAAGATFTSPNFVNSISRAYANLGVGVRGARISNNSWGAPVGGQYNANAQTYDGLVRDGQPVGSQFSAPGNQEMVIVISAGNSGPNATTMGSPATGKNVFSIGGSQNVRPGVGDAANADAMYGSSSRGPTADSARVKPDIIAPATNVVGGVVMNDRATGAPGNWNSCYTGAFLPTAPVQQRFYRTGNGTSFSGPAVAGGASLLRQWFINNGAPFYNTVPSPAMTKAYLMNAAQYMETLTDNLPSNSQGTGRMNLERAFDNTPRALRDQLPGDRFTASAQTRTFTGTVADNTRPFRVTMAFTDAPGSTTGASQVNNLDLEVTVGSQTFIGNRFSGRNSVIGGAADTLNNVESVFIPAGVSGPYTVNVRGTNIAGPGDPTIAGPNQDFALVVYNSTVIGGCPAIDVSPGTLPVNVVGGDPFPTANFAATGGAGTPSFFTTGNLPLGLTFSGNQLSGTPNAGGKFNFTVYARDSDGCLGGRGFLINVVSASIASTQNTISSGNQIVEPNECNDFNVRLTNSGGNPATAINSTLTTSTPGVSVAQALSPYPDLAPLGGTALNTDAFQISTDSSVACGSTIALTQTVTYVGGVSPSTFNFTLPVGAAGGNYAFGAPGTGASIPAGGSLVAGSSVDDAVLTVNLPAGFASHIYGTPVPDGSAFQVGTNGNIQFVASGGSVAHVNTALPATAFGATTPVLLPFWDDLDLRSTGGGIYTHTVGTAPNRQFIVEWRGRHFAETAGAQSVNFAVVLNEGSSGEFEYRYVQTATAAAVANGASATVGVQAANSGAVFTQSSFNQPVVSVGRVLPATLPPPICSPGAGVCVGGDSVFRNGFE